MKRCRDRGESILPFRVDQPENGYRFSIDSVLLADFASPLCGRSVLDLGTGSGVVLLFLARRCDHLKKGVGVEIQRPLWESARRNIPGLSPRSFDLVVANPPYRKIGEGRRNPDPGRETARHEVACTLADVFAATRKYLALRGRFALVCPSPRLPEVFALGAAAGILPQTVRFIHPRADEPANRALVAGSRRKAKGIAVLPPLVVHSSPGRYHPEVEGILSNFFRG